MEVKKYPKFDLQKWSVIFFQIGFIAMFLVTTGQQQLMLYNHFPT